MVHYICYLIFKYIWRWDFIDKVGPVKGSYVMIGAPHTSNWDFIPGMAIAYMTGKRCHFVIKKQWLRFPLKTILESIGAIGIDRESIKNGTLKSSTDLMAELFKQYDNFALMIAPEGTRSANDKWKTGFYYIAKKANVPIVLAHGNYDEKYAGLGKIIYPTDFEKDMHEIREFYLNVVGKNRSQYLPMQKI